MRNVSAIDDVETGWTTGPHGSGRTHSRLAARLQPPTMPSRRGCRTRCLGLVLVPLTMLIGGCALLTRLLTSLGADPPRGAVARRVTMPAVLLLVGGITWLLAWRWACRRHAVRMPDYLAARRAEPLRIGAGCVSCEPTARSMDLARIGVPCYHRAAAARAYRRPLGKHGRAAEPYRTASRLWTEDTYPGTVILPMWVRVHGCRVRRQVVVR